MTNKSPEQAERVYVLVAIDKGCFENLGPADSPPVELVAGALLTELFEDQFAVADVTDLVEADLHDPELGRGHGLSFPLATAVERLS